MSEIPKVHTIILWLLTSTLAIGLVAGAAWWLRQETTRPAVSINAPRDVIENTVPVYAQFTVTQTLYFESPVRATRLEIPVLVTSPDTSFTVELSMNQLPLAHWQVQTGSSSDSQVLPLALPVPTELVGDVEIGFAAPHLLPEQSDIAPRLYTEAEGRYYRPGHYRIADNAKQGDVSLAVIEQQPRWLWLVRHWRAEPEQAVLVVAQALVVSAVITSLPWALYRLVGPHPPQAAA